MQRPNFLLMLFGFVCATIILYMVFVGELQIHLPQAVYTSVDLQDSFASESEHEGLTKYIASDYFAVHSGGGVGNILFEFISIIGIARSLGRRPYIDAINSPTIKTLIALRPVFPNLAKQFYIRLSEESRVSIGISSGKCCVFNGINALERLNTTSDIFLKDNYLQFKYFESYADEIRSSILFINKSIVSIGRNGLLDGYTWNTTKHRICVHIRRGDFVKSALHMESREDFVVWAVNHIMLKELNEESAIVILFGNDHDWSVRVTEKFFNNSNIDGYVTKLMPDVTPVVDFAFARYNCDTILLTASASTFGWWSAYLAGPEKNIYYNTVFSKPNGVEKELNVADFFPPNWRPLNMPADYKLPSLVESKNATPSSTNRP